MHDLVIVVVDGFFLGLIYGLFALGLVVVYQGSRVINFAHGEIGMAGTFAFVELRGTHHLPLAVALLGGIALSVTIALITGVFVVRPLRDQPRVNSLVATFAVGALLLVIALRRYGLHPKYTQPIIHGKAVNIGGIAIQPIQVLMLGAVLVVVVSLTMLGKHSPFGLRLRATAMDPSAAGQVGVNVARTSMATWALAGAIAALCGILIASQVALTVGFMDPLLLYGLAAALIGGLTNPVGAFGAGISLGILEGLLNYTAKTPGLVEVSLAAVIVVVLLVRPSGLVRAAY